MDPSKIEKYFYLIQTILGAGFILALWLYAQRDRAKSNFKLREADRDVKAGTKRARLFGPESDKEEDTKETLRLEGVNITGKPHEILKVGPQATKKQILSAYRKLMKHYHPDKVAPPGTQQWQDAQEIASAINRAKEEMIKKLGKAS